MFFPQKMWNKKRTQEIESAYHDAAQFYWGKPEAWLKMKPIFSKLSTINSVSRWRACDIDTLEDWNQAETSYKISVKKKGQ